MSECDSSISRKKDTEVVSANLWVPLWFCCLQDMEKWAKAMNAQKDALKEEQRKITIAAGRKESAAADAGFAILQKSVSTSTQGMLLSWNC